MIQTIQDKLAAMPKTFQEVVEYYDEAMNWHIWNEGNVWYFLYLRALAADPYPTMVEYVSNNGHSEYFVSRHDADTNIIRFRTVGDDADFDTLYDAIEFINPEE